MDNSFDKYEVYTTTGSIYCYKDTNVLINKFKIKNNTELKQIEADITTIRLFELMENPITGQFSLSHLCKIHKYIFNDIYSFAGHIRRESIAKGNTIFETPHQIKNKTIKLLNELKSEKWLAKLERELFIKKLAYYFAELNYIHPFREGNGRSTREFIRLLVEKNGYVVNWSSIEINTLLDAMELSVFDTAALENVLDKCLTP